MNRYAVYMVFGYEYDDMPLCSFDTADAAKRQVIECIVDDMRDGVEPCRYSIVDLETESEVW